MAHITQLEDKLLADPIGKVRQHTLTQLLQAKQIVERQLRQSNSAEDHQALTLQLNACMAAIHIITTLWQRYHNW